MLYGREIGTTDHNEFLCGKCGQIEAEDGSEFALCDGACLRSFHVGCLVKDSKKTLKEAQGKNEKWYCNDCTEGELRLASS